MLAKIINENNAIFWYILNFMDLFMYSIFFKLILDSFSIKRFNYKISYLLLFLISMGSFIIAYENIFFYIISCIVFYKINYEGSILKGSIYSTFYWCVIRKIIELVSLHLVCSINYSNIDKRLEFMDGEIVQIELFIFKLVAISLLYLIYIYIYRYSKLRKIPLSFIYMLIPILTNIICVLLVFRYKVFNRQSSIEFIVVILMIFLSNIIFGFIFKRIINDYNVKQENKILTDNILKDYDYYLKIKEEQDKIKEIYHDIKNHMICLRDFCENSDTQRAINYIDNIESGMQKYNNLGLEFNTGNMIVDSILKNKKNLCIERKIDFDIDVDFSKIEFMDMVDICILFSNLIDNAIEASEKIQDLDIVKKIRLESKLIDSFYVIVIENNKTNIVNHKRGVFLTSKQDKFFHGIGLKNVKNIVNKYLGELVIEEVENRFIVKIIVPHC